MSCRSLSALVALVVPLASAAPVAALAEPAPTLVIEGKGFGHGVGMAQDGAYTMAAAGSSAAAILSRFYPGTSIGRRGTTMVRVAVHESTGPVTVVLPGGGELRDAPGGAQSPGFPVTVNPGGSVQLSFDGSKYKALPLAGAAINRAAAPVPPPASPPPTPAPAPTPPPPTTVPATTVTTGLLDPLLQALLPTTVPPTTAPPAAAGPPPVSVPASQKDAVTGRALYAVPKGDSPVAVPAIGRAFRGTVAATGAGRGLALTNEVDVEQYLRGLGEMPASWPAAALQAQAIAARTFAVRAAAAGQTLCDDQQCQVYIGNTNEHPATSAAAATTKGQVLMYKGALAEAVYSASAGGVSATAEEGFGPGSPDLPYLKPVTYTVQDPQLWAMTLPLKEAAARFGYRGELQQVTVARTGPSGRPLEIAFEGSNGPMAVDAHRFWAELQLRSTLFTVRTELAEPPPEGESLGARVPDLPSFSGDEPGSVALFGGSQAAESLGRTPWVGLAVLLLATWATMAHRITGRRPAPATPAAPPPDEGPTDPP